MRNEECLPPGQPMECAADNQGVQPIEPTLAGTEVPAYKKSALD